MNSKEEQANSEVTNLESESFIEQQKDTNYVDEQTEKNKLNEKSIDNEDKYKLDQKVSIGTKDYSVRLVASRHEETTILDIIEIQDINPTKKKKEKKLDVEY